MSWRRRRARASVSKIIAQFSFTNLHLRHMFSSAAAMHCTLYGKGRNLSENAPDRSKNLFRHLRLSSVSDSIVHAQFYPRMNRKTCLSLSLSLSLVGHIFPWRRFALFRVWAGLKVSFLFFSPTGRPWKLKRILSQRVFFSFSNVWLYGKVVRFHVCVYSVARASGGPFPFAAIWTNWERRVRSRSSQRKKTDFPRIHASKDSTGKLFLQINHKHSF